ncbi:MAG: methyltransferase domain-containing protein [Cyclobacteriaceae bacterium]
MADLKTKILEIVIERFKQFFPKWLKHYVKMQLHRGSNVVCPICQFESKDFEIVGIDVPVLCEKHIIGGGARRAGCFKCDSDDRERLLYVYLRDRFKVFDQMNLRILHIAPELNLAKKLRKARFQKYICGDLLVDGYQYPDFVTNLDVTSLPFDDGTFDLVICCHVLEHIPDDAKAMREIARVLTDYGKAILQVPISENSEHTVEDFSVTDPKGRTELFGQPDHVRIYGQDYTDRLKANGLSVTRVNISNEYPTFGLNPKEDLFVCELATIEE